MIPASKSTAISLLASVWVILFLVIILITIPVNITKLLYAMFVQEVGNPHSFLSFVALRNICRLISTNHCCRQTRQVLWGIFARAYGSQNPPHKNRSYATSCLVGRSRKYRPAFCWMDGTVKILGIRFGHGLQLEMNWSDVRSRLQLVRDLRGIFLWKRGPKCVLRISTRFSFTSSPFFYSYLPN